MARFGSDKPDTRILLELVDLTDASATSGFRAFRAAVDAGGIVKCLPVHDADALSRGEIDRLEAFVKKELGGKGLAWIRVGADRRVAVADREVPLRGGARRDRAAHRRAPGQPALLPGRRARARERGALAPAHGPRPAPRPRRRPRLGRALRRRLPALRARRGRRAHLRAPALRGAARGGPAAARDRARARARHALRHRDERRRARLGQPAQPPLRRAASRSSRSWATPRSEIGGALRVPVRRARRRRAAARRLRLRLRPLGDGARRLRRACAT